MNNDNNNNNNNNNDNNGNNKDNNNDNNNISSSSSNISFIDAFKTSKTSKTSSSKASSFKALKSNNTLNYLPNGNMTLTTKNNITTEFQVIINPETHKVIGFKKVNAKPVYTNNVVSIFKNQLLQPIHPLSEI